MGLYVLLFIFMNLILINTLAGTIIEEQSKISNYYRSNNAVKFTIRKDLDKNEIFKLYRLMDHTVLYCDICKIDDGKVIGVVFKDGTFTPHLIEGKLFTDDDFIKGTATAIVGKNIVDIQHYDGRDIELFEGKFQISGIIAYDNNSALDNVIFLNLTSLSAMPKCSCFYLDGRSAPKINSIIRKIADCFDIYVIADNTSPLDRIIVLSDQYANINKIIILIIALSIVIYCSFAFVALKRETHISILLGFSIWDVLKLVMERYLVYNLVVFLIILLEWLFLYFGGVKLPFLSLCIQLFLYLILINTVFLIYASCRFYRI